MYAYNFDIQTENGVDLGDYDYSSIMHYPRWAFSKNGKDTIVPHGDYEIGQRDGLSAGDINGVLEMYDLDASTATSTTYDYFDYSGGINFEYEDEMGCHSNH
jgi:hypothetical protein